MVCHRVANGHYASADADADAAHRCTETIPLPPFKVA